MSVFFMLYEGTHLLYLGYKCRKFCMKVGGFYVNLLNEVTKRV